MAKQHSKTLRKLEKAPTGIQGLDEITYGGLPKGRPTLICGGPGCGKSLFGIEFLARGTLQYGEPGVLMTFEENVDDIRKNIASLGFDLDQLIKQKKLAVDFVKVERQEIDENGEYDLEGLFIRLDYAIKSIGAKRVVLDTLESLFAGLNNQGILRAELRRLFRWLKDHEITTVITGERGESSLTRQGLEEYVSDCVILLDHRLHHQVSTRRLRVVKYRGTTHGTNEYPFLIDEDGISVLPITSVGLTHKAGTERISTGIPQLDQMLGGKGLYRGSSVLVTGTAGTGKSSLAGYFASASCDRGEKCLYFSFEESQSQIIRNVSSIGLDLGRHVRSGLLRFCPARPSLHGVETHLAVMMKQIADFKPKAVVVDPISNLSAACEKQDVSEMFTRLIDYQKLHEITGFFTSLTTGDMAREVTEMGISSLMDTWILLRDIELGGERNRGMYVLKSRGMPHSNQIREFLISSRGISLLEVYTGPDGVLTGSARLAQEARLNADRLLRDQEIKRKQEELSRKREALEAQIAALQAQFEAEHMRIMQEVSVDELRGRTVETDRQQMLRSRKGESPGENGDQNGIQKPTRRRK